MSLDNKINYGKFDKWVDNLEADYEINKAEYKKAKKIDVDKAFTHSDKAATVIKAAIFAAAFFIAYHITNVTLRLTAGVADLLDIKSKDPNKSGADPEKLAYLALLNPGVAARLGYKHIEEIENIAEPIIDGIGKVVDAGSELIDKAYEGGKQLFRRGANWIKTS